MPIPEEGITGFARPTLGDHHRAFNAALDDAVANYAEAVGPSETTELVVSFRIFVSVQNPGRIEGYAAKVTGA